MATATRRRPTAPSEGDTCCPPDNPQALDQLSAPKADPAADAELAAFAKALGHPVRVRILRMLAEKDARVCSRSIVPERIGLLPLIVLILGLVAAVAWIATPT